MRMSETLRDLACQLQALIRRAAAKEGLTTTQAYVIFAVPVGGVPLSGLANQLGLDASTISRIINKMASRGWVERKPQPADRRVIHVVLTSAGEAMYQLLAGHMDNSVENLMGDLDDLHQQQLSQDLEDLSWRLLCQQT